MLKYVFLSTTILTWLENTYPGIFTESLETFPNQGSL